MNNAEIDFLFFKKRIILVNNIIEDNFASSIVAKLIYLNTPPYDDVFLFINSTGGTLTSAFAVYDVIKWCKCRIITICIQQAAAFATFLLAAGSKGMRYAFEDSIILPALYPSLGDSGGLYTDKASEISSIFEKTISIYASLTNNSVAKMQTICMIDHKLKAEEALHYGYIDKIINFDMLKSIIPIDYFDVVGFIQSINKFESESQ